MTDASGAVPDPKRPPRWPQPPEAPWPGRILFGALGAVTGFVAALVSMTASWTYDYVRPPTPQFALELFGPPAAGLAAVVVLRLRNGKRWRWLSFLIGAVATQFAVGGVNWFLIGL